MLLISCRGNMAFSLPYFDVRFVGAILVKARPKRNISATVVADVKRFSHQINTDEVFGTHRCRYQRENGAAWGNSASDSVAPTRISSKKPLSLPKTRFERIDGVAHQGSNTRQYLRIARLAVCRAHPSRGKREFEPRCNRSRISQEFGAGALR